jgi:hypothetical protein
MAAGTHVPQVTRIDSRSAKSGAADRGGVRAYRQRHARGEQ